MPGPSAFSATISALSTLIVPTSVMVPSAGAYCSWVVIGDVHWQAVRLKVAARPSSPVAMARGARRGAVRENGVREVTQVSVLGCSEGPGAVPLRAATGGRPTRRTVAPVGSAPSRVPCRDALCQARIDGWRGLP